MLEHLERRDVPSGSPPTAANIGGLSVHHGQTLAGIDLVGNCSDPENDPLTVSIVNQPTKGMVMYNSTTGKYDYSSSVMNVGADSFTYRAFDGTSFSNTATVSLTITNTAPTTSNIGPLSVGRGQTISNIDLRAASFDYDGDSMMITVTAYPSHGMLMYDSITQKYQYTAHSNYAGPDSFTFKANDMAQDSNLAYVNFNITNQAPVANGQNVSAYEQIPKIITLTGSDADNDMLTWIIVAGPSHGTLSGTGANRTYVSDEYVGADSFTFKVNDGFDDSNVATVNITVGGSSLVAANGTVLSFTDRNNTENDLSVTMVGGNFEFWDTGAIALPNPLPMGWTRMSDTRVQVPSAGFTKIHVLARGGNDHVDCSALTTPVDLFGGLGDDTMYGGSGNDLIVSFTDGMG